MFNSTHTFVGLLVAKTGAEKWFRGATLTAVIASNLPDVDSVAGFWGTAAYLDHHRGITHALIGVPVLALALSAVMYRITAQFWRTYAVALIAMATHPALDYLNSYGLRPFLPWSSKSYYGDLLFIFDPLLDLILVIGLLAGWWWPHRKQLAALASVFLAFTYLGVRLQLHGRAAEQIEKLAMQNREIETWAVMPGGGNPVVWDAIVATKSEVMRFDVCALPCSDIDAETVPMKTAPPSDAVRQAATTPSAAAFLRFARFPVTRVETSRSGYRVTFIDLRFYRAGGTALGSQVILDSSLRVLKENVSFVQSVN
jgi:inner membrane protein